ncbi:ermin-like [Leucoraja erinacea]|uniref:ermin-like n=1 Tax=Leucoraja erinaceus TaxID=7782 RepID=UPI002455DED7|nr:ermin-like [Leucoraja erinacea]
MAEEDSNVPDLVETDNTVTSENQPDVVDDVEGAGGAVQSTEEKASSGVVSECVLTDNVTPSKGSNSTAEEYSSPSGENVTSTETIASNEETTPNTEEATSHHEVNTPALEVIPCIEEASSDVKQVITTAEEITYPAAVVSPGAEEACSSSELAEQSAEMNHSTADETTSSPAEQTVTPVATPEEAHQPAVETVLTTENAKSFTAGTFTPEVPSIQSSRPESDTMLSSPSTEEEITPQNNTPENSADDARSEAVENMILLPPEEDYSEKGEHSNVANHNAGEIGDVMESDEEEIYSEEFQQGNDLESPSSSPIQPESPTNTDCVEEQSGSSRRPDIAKHSYSRYNTVSYRKIKKGITKQRIDEFESMLQIT